MYVPLFTIVCFAARFVPTSSLQWGDWDIKDTKEIGTVFTVGSLNGLNGPVKLVWRTESMGDDEYFIELFQQGSRIYISEHHTNDLTGRSNAVGSEDARGDYKVQYRCDHDDFSFRNCDGRFRWTLVSCGCPADKPIKTKGCTDATPESASDAECDSVNISDPVGRWDILTSGPVSLTYEMSVAVTIGNAVVSKESFEETLSSKSKYKYRNDSIDEW